MGKEVTSVIAYVSSRNNYRMLQRIVIPWAKRHNVELINVDDGSSIEQIKFGKSICKSKSIVFLQNKDRGVQWATQTVIDFVNENRPNCKALVCFQHDILPLSNNFFKRLQRIVDSNKFDDIGLYGFNVLDSGKYTGLSLLKYFLGLSPLGMIGMLHLSVEKRDLRWLCPRVQPDLLKNYKWKKPFLIEFPMWAAIGINVTNWNKYIAPSNEYQFHLWLPDIAMQFNSKNIGSLVLPNLYCYNAQWLKLFFGIPKNSALGAKAGNDYYFGKYSPFEVWKKRWGWEYEDALNTFPSDKYEGLLSEFYNNDIKSGPIKNYLVK